MTQESPWRGALKNINNNKLLWAPHHTNFFILQHFNKSFHLYNFEVYSKFQVYSSDRSRDICFTDRQTRGPMAETLDFRGNEFSHWKWQFKFFKEHNFFHTLLSSFLRLIRKVKITFLLSLKFLSPSFSSYSSSHFRVGYVWSSPYA